MRTGARVGAGAGIFGTSCVLCGTLSFEGSMLKSERVLSAHGD